MISAELNPPYVLPKPSPIFKVQPASHRIDLMLHAPPACIYLRTINHELERWSFNSINCACAHVGQNFDVSAYSSYKWLSNVVSGTTADGFRETAFERASIGAWKVKFSCQVTLDDFSFRCIEQTVCSFLSSVPSSKFSQPLSPSVAAFTSNDHHITFHFLYIDARLLMQ